MGADGKQRLTIESVAQGFDRTAKDIGKVSEGLNETTAASKRTGEGAEVAASGIDKLVAANTRLVDSIREQLGDREKLASTTRNLAERGAELAKSGFKIVFAVRAVNKALRALPAAAALARAGWSIVQQIKAEIVERRRLVAVLRIQADVTNDLQARSRALKDTLESAAGTRKVGGFTADSARRVRSGAERAGKQFTQLPPDAVNKAFGTFGDVEGLSQKDLTDLAIIGSFGELGDVDTQTSREGLRRQAGRLLDRFRSSGRIDKFAERETRQGQGLGRAEFRHGPTEKAQAIASEAVTPGGSDALLRQRLKELLPPEADLDQAVRLFKLFGTSGAFNDAKVGFASSRGLTAAQDRFFGRTEVGLPDQPGFGNQAFEAVGITRQFESMRTDVFEYLDRAFRQIDREGGVTNHFNFQNAKIIGPSARSQRRRITNGQTRAEDASRRILGG